MRLQFRLEIRKEDPAAFLSHDTNNTHTAPIQNRRKRSQGVRMRRPVEVDDIGGGCRPYRDLLGCDTDSISTSAAISVQGRGLCACRHILESGSHSPPNGKLGS